MNVSATLVKLGKVELTRGANGAARQYFAAALDSAQRMGWQEAASLALGGLGQLDLLERDRQGALRHYVRALEAAVESETGRRVLSSADGVALAAAAFDAAAAARILGASRALRVKRGIALDRLDETIYATELSGLPEPELAAGAGLAIDDVVDLAFDLARRAGANVDSP